MPVWYLILLIIVLLIKDFIDCVWSLAKYYTAFDDDNGDSLW